MSSDTPRPVILSVLDVSKRFGAQEVLSNVSLTLHEGDRIGLIGSNGSGKSTLLKLMAGRDLPEEGQVVLSQGIRTAMLNQECALDRTMTVGDVLERASQDIRALLAEHAHLMTEIPSLPEDSPARRRAEDRLHILDHELEITGAWESDQDLRRVTVALDLPDPSRVLGTLSGGELRRVDLASVVLQRPDLLLLDEPTNHIDVRSANWIESFLSGYAGSCVLVTHDRYFLDRVVNRIVEIEFARLLSYPGNYEQFLEHKSLRQSIEARTDANRRSVLRRELEWLRRGPKARATKQKARIDRYYALEEQGGAPEARAFCFEIPVPKRLGKQILEVEKIAKTIGDVPLFRDFSFIFQQNMRIGVIGPNGCGKTTLLKVLMGLDPQDSGSLTTGENTEFLYVDQGHESIDPDKSVLQHFSRGCTEMDVRGRRIFIPGYLERFLFDRQSLQTPMRNLSGGERNRLDLAKKLLRGGNFLVLDEPTNDLDLTTLRLLEETIINFEGCVLLVSHDRYFLNRVCTHLFVFEGEGRVVVVTGDYDDYLLYKENREAELKAADRAQRAANTKRSDKAAAPARLTYQQKKELEAMESTIHAAEAEVARIEAVVSAPGFYTQPHESTRQTLEQLDQARKHVEALYERWAVLEDILSGSAS